MAKVMTKAQAEKLKKIADHLWAARITAEKALDQLEAMGVDLDYDHLELKNHFTNIEDGVIRFYGYAQDRELEAVQ